MIPVADDPSVLEYQDPVEIHHAGQAVGDEQNRLVRHTGFDVLNELVFADGIKGGRRLPIMRYTLNPLYRFHYNSLEKLKIRLFLTMNFL